MRETLRKPRAVTVDGMSDHTDEYVTNDAWVRTVGRPDAIDDVADQFERPSGAARFWSHGAAPAIAWPERSRGWREQTGLRRTA